MWGLAAIRAGVLRASYEYRDELNSGYGREVRDVTLSDSSWGGVLDLELAAGYHPSANLGFGLGVDLVFAHQSIDLIESEFGASYTAGIKAMFVWRPGPSWSLSAAPGIAQAGFALSTNDIGDAYNIVEPENARGVYGSLGAGYGMLNARLFFGHLTGEHSTYVPIFLSLGAQFTAW